jgi:hypothetical protein
VTRMWLSMLEEFSKRLVDVFRQSGIIFGRMFGLDSWASLLRVLYEWQQRTCNVGAYRADIQPIET